MSSMNHISTRDRLSVNVGQEHPRTYLLTTVGLMVHSACRWVVETKSNIERKH
jgi:hypothetical protein